jgi:uncharacterized protein (TIRG00374 family)
MPRWLVIVASLAILLALVKAAGFRQVAETWGSVAPAGVVLAVACYYASVGLRILAWRLLLGADAPSARALAAPLAIGFVLGHVTPAKSGEPVTALLVSRSFGLPLSRSLSVLVAERGAQLVTLLATFVPAATATAGSILEVRGAVRAAAACLAVLLVAIVFAPPLLTRLAPLATRVPRFGDGIGRFLSTLSELLSTPRRVVPLLLLTTVFWILQYVSLWAILRAGGTSVNPIEAAAVAGAAILGGTLTMLPLGTQDGISALVLGGLGVPLARGFALALFHTALSLACGLLLVAGAVRSSRGPSVGGKPDPVARSGPGRRGSGTPDGP